MEIRHYTKFEKDTWDKFVFSSSMGWAYFLYDMIKFHSDESFINESFAIVDNENILMIMQLHRTPKKTLTSQWGFVIANHLTKKQKKLLKSTYEKHIDFLMKKYQIKKFDINIAPLTADNLPEKHNMVNPVLFYNFAPSIRYTYIVDLSKPDDRLLADCEETTRQAIRNIDDSHRYSVIKSEGSEEDCKTYIKLHKETYTRTGASSAIIADSYHKNIFETLIPEGIANVYFLKDNIKNEYVATVAILIYNKTAYYWWGSSKNDKEIGVNKYLLFKVIYETKQQFENQGYFETGGAYPFLRGGKYKGLNDYKKCFGTFLHPIFTGVYVKIPVPHKVINIFGIKISYKTKTLMAVERERERERESNPSSCKKSSLKGELHDWK